MNDDLSKLEPQALWRHFAAICAIPHVSGDEAALAAGIERFCQTENISCERDAAGNLRLDKPATSAELADAPKIILQAHLDMVPQAAAGSKHDFATDPITPVVDGGWVRADGTTLGADNGVGVAAILALMESDAIAHGPLAAVLTVEEETGLRGANALDPSFLDGGMLINLDSETFGELYVACAGGVETTFVRSVRHESLSLGDWTFFGISVSGLEGGHSGVDIHLGRANAVSLLSSVLAEIADSTNLRLAKFAGGSLSNAIPREASAEIAVSGLSLEEVSRIAAECERRAKDVYPDRNLKISPVSAVAVLEALPVADSAEIISALSRCPNGVRGMSDKLPGIVETSSNIGSAELREGVVRVVTMQRSLVESEMNALSEEMGAHMRRHGFTAERGEAFPPWEPARDSRIVEAAVRAHGRLFGEAPKILAIHAGLECGIIGRLNPKLDMVSFGPTIKHPHSPSEKVDSASVADFFRLLVETLEIAQTSGRS